MEEEKSRIEIIVKKDSKLVFDVGMEMMTSEFIIKLEKNSKVQLSDELILKSEENADPKKISLFSDVIKNGEISENNKDK